MKPAEFSPLEVLNEHSKKIRITNRRQSVSLPLFQSMPIQLAESASFTRVLDCVMYCGGLCWTMDWCPSCTRIEYLAISCHPKHHSKNTIGSIRTGVNIVQIWSIQSNTNQQTPPMEMSLGLFHNSALCWDLQWCPDPQYLSTGSTTESIGLLGMALGDGQVQVVSVPVPKGTDGTRYVELDPVARIHSTDLSGSVVSCMDWLPIAPHDLLLLGSWDGSVFIWGLPCPNASRIEMQLLIKHQIDYLALRRVCWLRTNKYEVLRIGGVRKMDDLSVLRNYFCAVGHSGRFMLWDSLNLFQPILDRSLSRTWLLDLAISGNPPSIFVAVEDASIRQLPLDVSCLGHVSDRALFHHYSGDNTGANLSICCSDNVSLTAYGGEDGEILVFPTENTGDTRYRKPHLCAGGIQYDPSVDEIKMLTASEVGKIGGAYIGGSVLKSKGIGNSEQKCIPVAETENQTIQCLKFSPNGGQTCWLAAGTIAGLIRLIRISK